MSHVENVRPGANLSTDSVSRTGTHREAAKMRLRRYRLVGWSVLIRSCFATCQCVRFVRWHTSSFRPDKYVCMLSVLGISQLIGEPALVSVMICVFPVEACLSALSQRVKSRRLVKARPVFLHGGRIALSERE